MSIEGIKTDLDAASGHLQKAEEAARNGQNIAHTIWETVGGLAAQPSYLHLLQPPAASLIGTKREVTPQDITAMIDTAATGYSEAHGEI